jgi:anti-anti-sigma regulatory factor
VEGKGKMVLCGIRPVVREVFQITRLDKVFEIYSDAGKAQSALELI